MVVVTRCQLFQQLWTDHTNRGKGHHPFGLVAEPLRIVVSQPIEPAIDGLGRGIRAALS